MLNIRVKVTKQDLKDFPLHTLEVDEKWKDVIDPSQDYKFQNKRKKCK